MHGRIRNAWDGLALALAGAAFLAAAGAARADFDHSKYMSPDELRPGMKGFGRTVMSGSKIETFQIEIITVMRNAFYAKQDVILARCSGLNLEHSGIIGGMSGSPCYIHGDDGKDRMIGAVAYGWTFNKDPVCGVQPITQMLPISDVRAPKATSPGEKSPPAAASGEKRSGGGSGVDLGKLVGRVAFEPLDPHSRFSLFNDEVVKALATASSRPAENDGLRPLLMPVMVSGMSERGMGRLARRFERYGLTPVASGGPSAAALSDADNVKLEPGSALCIPFMTGDIIMEGLGTCTEVIGDRVLGFGHSMFGEGSVELPLATGIVHTVISSVMRSNKMGAAIKTVGTLFGDENSGIFGVTGPPAAMVPVEVVVRDLRGERTYHYNIVQEQFFSGVMLDMAISGSIFAHNDPPKEHTIRYSIETEFKDLGTYRTSNVSSQGGTGGVSMDAVVPPLGLMNSPFGKAKLVRSRVEVTVEKEAHLATIDEAKLDKSSYKPGESVTARVRWQHYLGNPQYTRETYQLKLPEDLPDGEYDLTVGSNKAHLLALRQEKPHLFHVDSLAEMLKAFNMITSFPDNRVYLHLVLPTGGLAVRNQEMPRLPSYRRQTLLTAHRSDVTRFTDALLASFETPFAVEGAQSLKFRVNRRADQ